MIDPGDDTDGPPRVALIAALVVAVAAVVAALAVAAAHRPESQPDEPLRIATVPAPHAGGAACRAVLDGLPQQLGDYHRAEIADPAPDGAAAWTAGANGTVVL
ncbi:DUF3515 family protein, partial [Mycolicibacter algericus]